MPAVLGKIFTGDDDRRPAFDQRSADQLRPEVGSGFVEVGVPLHADPQGAAVFERSCGTEEEARTFASTVEQHIAWLSEEKFRRYYRIAEPEGA